MKAPWILLLGLCLLLLAGSPSVGQYNTHNSTDNRKDKWEQIDTFEGVVLFRSLEEVGDLLPFKAIAELNIPYQRIVMALVDAEHKNNWAPKLKSITVHNEISANRFEYSEYYTTPWPFYDREFLLMGTVQYLRDRILFTAINSSNKQLADKDHLLANVKMLEVVIIPLSADRTQVEFTFSGDLGGWIPNFVKNIIQKNGLYALSRQCKHILLTVPHLKRPDIWLFRKANSSFPPDHRGDIYPDRGGDVVRKKMCPLFPYHFNEKRVEKLDSKKQGNYFFC